MKSHVAVLMGGWSGEREVSLISGGAVSKVLQSLGNRVTEIDVGPNIGEVLSQLQPDVAFNALHGRFGEDGCIQGVLETLGIPYTHSGVLASALAMNKPAAKKLFATRDIPSPEGKVVPWEVASSGRVMEPPYVIKPLGEGSSLGIGVIKSVEEESQYLTDEWLYGDHVLVERYIPGRELTVAIMDDRALGVMEILSHGSFYSYDAKYVEGNSEHLLPAPLSTKDYEVVRSLALEAHRCLGCRGLTRADLRYDDTKVPGEFFLLEVNTQPGMTPTSLVPEIAMDADISFKDLVSWILEDASCGR